MTNHAAVAVASSVPTSAEVVGVPVRSSGTVPRQLGLSRSALEANGFTGAAGQVLAVPSSKGATMVAVGAGDGLSANELRDAAAALTRACGKRASLATTLPMVAADDVSVAAAAQAVTEGVLLASYRYVGSKNDASIANPLTDATLVMPAKASKQAKEGVTAGIATSRAARLARELANTPPNLLNARDIAAQAVELGAEYG
ncbi:MAG: M17 family peptidase N-terminal domain-containing protein, partial [Ilumatobacter fluminis]